MLHLITETQYAILDNVASYIDDQKHNWFLQFTKNQHEYEVFISIVLLYINFDNKTKWFKLGR